MDYKVAGVDIEAGYESVKLMKQHVMKTMRKEVLTGLGGFSGMFSLKDFQYSEPVLVSGTDGVGTKLKLAFVLDKHDTIGIDCVAMCVNDIVCSGAQPLFFLDYIACGKNHPHKIAEIVKGVAKGCTEANAALVGGETAEMPGFYKEDEYDLAGFAVGIVDAVEVIDGSKIVEEDLIIGLASSGVHSNGFSLVRKVFSMERASLETYNEVLGDSIGNVLLQPTRIYVRHIQALKKANINIKACAHITGGGFYENIPRMLPEGFYASINKDSYQIPPIFKLLQQQGNIQEEMMYNTFNMGIGMTIVISSEEANEAIKILAGLGLDAYVIGRVKKGSQGVELC